MTWFIDRFAPESIRRAHVARAANTYFAHLLESHNHSVENDLKERTRESRRWLEGRVRTRLAGALNCRARDDAGRWEAAYVRFGRPIDPRPIAFASGRAVDAHAVVFRTDWQHENDSPIRSRHTSHIANRVFFVSGFRWQSLFNRIWVVFSPASNERIVLIGGRALSVTVGLDSASRLASPTRQAVGEQREHENGDYHIHQVSLSEEAHDGKHHPGDGGPDKQNQSELNQPAPAE